MNSKHPNRYFWTFLIVLKIYLYEIKFLSAEKSKKESLASGRIKNHNPDIRFISILWNFLKVVKSYQSLRTYRPDFLKEKSTVRSSKIVFKHKGNFFPGVNQKYWENHFLSRAIPRYEIAMRFYWKREFDMDYVTCAGVILNNRYVLTLTTCAFKIRQK